MFNLKRLSLAYHLVPYNQELDEPNCSPRGQYLLTNSKSGGVKLDKKADKASSRNSTLRADIVNDRLIAFKSLNVKNERTVATKEYYVIYFYIHGMM